MSERTKEDLKQMMWELPIREQDDALRQELCAKYGKMYPRQWFTSACCEDALNEASEVDSRANVRLNDGVLYLRYRSDYLDDGMAIWRSGKEDFHFYRWQRMLD